MNTSSDCDKSCFPRLVGAGASASGSCTGSGASGRSEKVKSRGMTNLWSKDGTEVRCLRPFAFRARLCLANSSLACCASATATWEFHSWPRRPPHLPFVLLASCHFQPLYFVVLGHVYCKGPPGHRGHPLGEDL